MSEQLHQFGLTIERRRHPGGMDIENYVVIAKSVPDAEVLLARSLGWSGSREDGEFDHRDYMTITGCTDFGITACPEGVHRVTAEADCRFSQDAQKKPASRPLGGCRLSGADTAVQAILSPSRQYPEDQHWRSEAIDALACSQNPLQMLVALGHAPEKTPSNSTEHPREFEGVFSLQSLDTLRRRGNDACT